MLLTEHDRFLHDDLSEYQMIEKEKPDLFASGLASYCTGHSFNREQRTLTVLLR
jgi:hypothetical protein